MDLNIYFKDLLSLQLILQVFIDLLDIFQHYLVQFTGNNQIQIATGLSSTHYNADCIKLLFQKL